MAVYTFSTKDVKRPEDKVLVDAVKEHCERTNQNFSVLVVALLRKFSEEQACNTQKK